MLKSQIKVWKNVRLISFYSKYLISCYWRLMRREKDFPSQYFSTKSVNLMLISWDTPFLYKDTFINRIEEAVSFIIRLKMMCMSEAENEQFKKLLLKPKYSNKYRLSFKKMFDKIDAREDALMQIQTALDQINEWRTKKKLAGDTDDESWQRTILCGISDNTDKIKAVMENNLDWIYVYVYIMQNHDSIAEEIINLKLLSSDKAKHLEDCSYLIVPVLEAA